MYVGHFEFKVWLVFVLDDDIGGKLVDDSLEPRRVVVNRDEMFPRVFHKLDSVMNLFLVELDLNIEFGIVATVFLYLCFEVIDRVLLKLIIVHQVRQ